MTAGGRGEGGGEEGGKFGKYIKQDTSHMPGDDRQRTCRKDRDEDKKESRVSSQKNDRTNKEELRQDEEV